MLKPFFSRQLHGAQCRYSAQELEGLGLFESIRHFKVVTDHKPLVSLMTAPQKNKRLLNWAIKVGEFHFKVIYRKGGLNWVADCLSRRDHDNDVDNNVHHHLNGGGERCGHNPHEDDDIKERKRGSEVAKDAHTDVKN